MSSNEGRFKCTDIDECVKMTHTCHQDATCANIIGSYECNCIEGFTGGGQNAGHAGTDDGCVDSDECLTGAHSCVANRTRFETWAYFEIKNLKFSNFS